MNTLQKSKYRFCGDRHETINHIISEFSKLAQKVYNTRYVWLEKMIHMELCKKFRFNSANKWYTHKPESVLENETHICLWDFEI